MSAAHPEECVAAASRDALRASASASVAPTAASPAPAAASSAPGPPRVDEAAAVKQCIAHVDGEIIAVEKEIAEAKRSRDACPVGSELRQEHTAELQRLGRKEDRLRDEKAQLRDELKRKELALERAVTQPLDLAPLLGVIARIEAGQQALTVGQQTLSSGQQVLTASQQALTAEVRALSAQAQSPSRAQDGERAWQLCPDQSDGLPAAVVAVALQRAAERGARVSAELAERPLIPQSNLQTMRASLPKASWELELIVLVTPYLRAVTQHLAAAAECVLVNSEVFSWIQTPLDNRRLWQKPDLFLCHQAAYVPAERPGQESENAQWQRAIQRMDAMGAEQFLFGRCAWPLRDVVECFFEGKRQRLSLHEATGECLAKARNLLYRSAQERSFVTPRQLVKCVMFDQDDVYLLQFDSSPEGGLLSARKFGWAAPGSFVVLLDFLQAPPALTPNWLRVLRSALSHFGCGLPPSASFLGHGGTGRVFQVSADEGYCALKVVETGSADDRVALLEAELLHLRKLRQKAAGTPALALLPTSPDEEVFICDDSAVFPPRPCGAAVRFAPIGESVALRYPKERPQQLWREVSSALALLHEHGCCHGDARLENLILVPYPLPPLDGPAGRTRNGAVTERLSWQLGEARLVWIDFRESSVHPQRRALDCHTLLCSFFRISPSARDQRVALFGRDYEQVWAPPAVDDRAPGAAVTSTVAACGFATWQESVWRTLGANPKPG